MGQKIFVPLTDEILYGHPELYRDGLVPYSPEIESFHWLKEAEVEIEYPDGQRQSITHHAA